MYETLSQNKTNSKERCIRSQLSSFPESNKLCVSACLVACMRSLGENFMEFVLHLHLSWILRITLKSPGLCCKSLYRWSHLAHHLKYEHMCSCMCKGMYDYLYVSIDIYCYGAHVEVRGQPWVLGCASQLVWDRASWSLVHMLGSLAHNAPGILLSPLPSCHGVQDWRYRFPFRVRWFLDIQTPVHQVFCLMTFISFYWKQIIFSHNICW